jgi:hypothetical protein
MFLCCEEWVGGGGGGGREGYLLLNFNFEIFCSGSELPVSQSKFIVAPLIFRYSPVAPYKLGVDPWGAIRPTL